MKRIFIGIVVLLCSEFIFAINGNSDFSAITPSGHTLYYKITGSSVTVVEPPINPLNRPPKIVGDVIVPDTVIYNNIAYVVDSIDNEAFRECDSMFSILIKPSVVYIGSLAFCDCINLASVSLPNTINYIGERAFAGCYSLTAITIPSAVSVIEEMTFSNCTSLDTVILPSSLKKIGYSAFERCGFSSIGLPSSLEEVEDGVFEECVHLSSITIPSKVTKIASGMFIRCSSLKTVVLPSTVKMIDGYAFYDCTSLIGIDLPSVLDSIGDYAFAHCYNIMSIKSQNESCPIIMGDSTFSGISTNIEVRVPSKSIDRYKNTYGWKYFNNIQGYGILCNIIVNANDTTMGIVVGGGEYNVDQQITIIATPNQGYEFAQWQDGNTQANRVITVTSDSTFTAYFQADQGDEYTIIVKSIDNTMGEAYGGGSYSKNATTTIMAAPNTGYEFVQWQDGDKNDVRTITVTADSTFTAYFRASTGVEEANRQDINVYAADNIIVVQGAENEKVSVYDITGRVLYSTTCAGTEYKVNVSASGIYIVRIGKKCVKKVVVINRM